MEDYSGTDKFEPSGTTEESDSGTVRERTSRRALLSSLAGGTAVALSSQTILGSSVPSEGQTVHRSQGETSDNARYSAFVTVPTFTRLELDQQIPFPVNSGWISSVLKEPDRFEPDVIPISPRPDRVDATAGNPDFEDNFTGDNGGDGQTHIVIPHKKNKDHQEDTFVAHFQFAAGVKLFGEPENAEYINVNVTPQNNIAINTQQDSNGIRDTSGTSINFPVDELESAEENSLVKDSSKYLEGVDFTVEFEQIDVETRETTVRPFILEVTVTVFDEDYNKLRTQTGTQKCVSIGSKIGVHSLLKDANFAWNSGLAVVDDVASAPVSEMYQAQKMHAALQTESRDDPYVMDAVINDVAAFKPPIRDDPRVFHGKEGKTRLTGLTLVGGLRSAESSSSTTTKTTTPAQEEPPATTPITSTQTPETTSSDRIDGLNFAINPVSPNELTCIHKDSGDTSYRTENFQVRIDTDNVNKEVSLAEVTSDTRFEPGDQYPLNQDTLGLKSPLEVEGGQFTLFYQDDGDWLQVVRLYGVSFGKPSE